jgi:hypothetical protein
MTKKLLVLIALLAIVSQASAQLSDEQLAQFYAPVLKFNEAELFYPVEAEYHIRNSRLMQEGIVIDGNPTASSISSYSDEDYYLDNKLGGLEEIANDYRQNMAGLPPVSYYRVSRSQGYTALQYWLFYAFNDGPLNEHEGDWELVVILINPQGIPEWAAYSQHHGGSRVAWNDVERIGNNPVVYSSRGSHAHYFRPYEGRFGLQNDDVGGSGITIAPEQLELRHLESQSWLSFGGRWGDSPGEFSKVTGGSGPFGPSTGDHGSSWNDPVGWAMSQPLKGGSAFMVDWIIYNFALIFIVYIIVRLAIKIIMIARLSQRGELHAKELFSSSFSIWLFVGILSTAIIFAGIMSPWYAVSGSIESDEVVTDGPVELMSIDGMRGLQINTLQKGAGMSTVFAVIIPVGLLLLAGVIFTITDIIGASSGKKLGAKYLFGGIGPLISFILVIAAVASISSILPSVEPMFGDGIPPETEGLIAGVAASPLGSAYQGPFGDYAMLDIQWGMGIGAYLMLIGGIIRIIAGIAMIASAPDLGKSRLAQAPVTLNIVQQPMQYSAHQAVQQARACPKCGVAATPGENFCHICGTRVT